MRINLKDFRQSHKMFQSDMAELLEVNQSNVSRAELRGYFTLSYPQVKKLYEKFGKEDVDSFSLDKGISVSAFGNSNEGSGTQNNGYFHMDTNALDIISRQSEAVINLAQKQAEQTDRLIVLLEKLSKKLCETLVRPNCA